MRKLMDFVQDTFAVMPPFLRNTAFIGGGALRTFFDNTSIKDIDLFFQDELSFRIAQEKLAADPEFADATTDEALLAGCPTYAHPHLPAPLNLVGFRFAPGINELAHSFDLRCCAMAACVRDGSVFFYAAPGAIEDAEAKLLTILNQQAFVRVKKRVRRYVGYGYSAGPTLRSSLFKSRRIRGTNTNY